MKALSTLAFLLLFQWGWSQTSQAGMKTPRMKINIDSAGQAVTLDSDTILFLHTSFGTISVAERAEIVSRKLNEVATLFDHEKDSIKLLLRDDYSLVVYKDKNIIQITDLDAAYEGISLSKLSKRWYSTMDDSLHFTLTQKETVFQYLLSFAIILLVLLVINYLLKKVFGRLNKWLTGKKGKYFKGIRIKSFEIMDADDELELMYKISFVLRMFVMLLIAYIVFPIIFSLFPATKFIATRLIGWVLDPVRTFGNAIVSYIPNLITIVVIVYIVRQILKYLRIAAKRVEYGRIKIKGFYPDWSKTTYELIRIMIIALTFVMLFPYLPGAQSDVFKGVSVFIGVIFSLGSTSIVGNLVAGLVLTYMRPFKIGDRIKIGEVEGEIVEKTAFVIRIKTPKNEYITIPNSNVQSAHIINYNRSISEGGVILFSEITIGYDVPWRQVHELLLKAADLTPELEKEPHPFVLQKALNDFSVAYQINAYTKRPLYKDLTNSLLHQNIQDIFAEAEVEILSPRYMASRDGNASTIPKTGPQENKE